ncbi:LADA_0C03356g1_1 [Lachancea dasiensis]|uniref:LADA_0C03356g1_1 n=1 Tax=Lachancea dasiensis TaxID=1072105 RepID=A0A1G4IYG1_9SACH|nr:LADA_0C03356g1_1 [Lachancea dasiensis]
MSNSFASLFKSRILHVDLTGHKDSGSRAPELANESAIIERSRPHSNSSNALNAIKEEERSVSGSSCSDCNSKEGSGFGQTVPKSGKLRNLKDRITSFPDLKFRSFSSLSSMGQSSSSVSSTSDVQGLSSASGSVILTTGPVSNSANKLPSSTSSSTPDRSPIISVTCEKKCNARKESVKQSRHSASEKRLSGSSITRTNTGSSSTSLNRNVPKSKHRVSLIRSNSDNNQRRSLGVDKHVSESTFVQGCDTGLLNFAQKRQRSRTVGASDFENKSNSPTQSLRNLKVRTDINNDKSPSNVNSEKLPSNTNFLLPPSGPTHARQSSSSRQSTTSSRRSSSLVNALSNLVTMRSASVSSRTSSYKAAVAFEDLPTPPAPELEETVEQYLRNISNFGNYLAIVLTERNDEFKDLCLTEFLRKEFDFAMEPLDISLRKLLLFLELPKESQQIDRVLSAFSRVYLEQTKSICVWNKDEEVLSMSFSLLMLHTDHFNANNKIKMTKQEFVKLMRTEDDSKVAQTPKEILEYFYDNITAREFSKNIVLDQNFYGNGEGEDDYEYATSTDAEYSPKRLIKEKKLVLRSGTSTSSFTKYDSVQTVTYFGLNSSGLQIRTSSLRGDCLDIYHQIASDNIQSCTIGAEVLLPSFEKISVPVSLDCQHLKYLSIMKETKGGYLLLRKSVLESIPDMPLDVLEPPVGQIENRYLKIIQMGCIEERITNRKFSLVGNVSRQCWKRYFGVLTTSCLLLFSNMDWVEPRLAVDKTTGTSNYIIDCPSSTDLARNLGSSGLFAMRVAETGGQDCSADESPEDCHSAGHWAMYIYSRSKRLIFACPNKQDRDNWIDAINVVAATDSCSINMNAIPGTAVTPRKFSVNEKLRKLKTTRVPREEKFRRTNALLQYVKCLVPLNAKIKAAVVDYLKLLERRLQWIQYESCRNEVFSQVLLMVADSAHDAEDEKDLGDSIDQSFIFDDSLIPCNTDSSSDPLRKASSTDGDILASLRN